MVDIRIYVEGGGDQKRVKSKCRAGFRMFFEKVLPKGTMPRIIACGNRSSAYEDFCTALKVHSSRNTFCILLIDSEAPVDKGMNNWKYLENRDQWKKPQAADENSAHLMVQCMEAWFLADKACLSTFFGQGFAVNSLPANPNVEKVSKEDIFAGLDQATRNTKKKGKYGKGKHSFEILGRIHPDKVRNASPHAEYLLKTLENTISDSSMQNGV